MAGLGMVSGLSLLVTGVAGGSVVDSQQAALIIWLCSGPWPGRRAVGVGQASS